MTKCEIDSLFTLSQRAFIFDFGVSHPLGCYHGNLAWLCVLAFVRGRSSKYMLDVSQAVYHEGRDDNYIAIHTNNYTCLE